MTLKQMIIDDVADVFLDTDEMAVQARFVPKGVIADRETVILHDFADGLEGTREVHGDGTVLHAREGTRLRESHILEVESRLSIEHADGHHDTADVFELSEDEGVTWQTYFVKRIMGKDVGMQAVLVIRTYEDRTLRIAERG